MKIILDFNDLTNLIIADLADKGIQVSEQDIEYTENGVEISISNLGTKPVKPIKPKQTRTVKKQEQEPIVEDETEIEEETKEPEINIVDKEDEVELTEETIDSDEDDDSLFD
jgi:hypothetical protein